MTGAARTMVAVAVLVAALIVVGERLTSDDEQRVASEELLPAGAAVTDEPNSLDTVWFCVGGPSGAGGVTSRIQVTNFSDESETVAVSAVSGAGESVDVEVSIEAGASESISLEPLGATRGVGATVSSVSPEVVPVVVTATADGDGAAAECTASSHAEWILPLGSTEADTTQTVLVFNPHPGDAVASISFRTEEGIREPGPFASLLVRGGEVRAIRVGDEVARRPDVVSVIEARSGQLVVGRHLAQDGTGDAEGTSLALGVAEARTTWVFASGGAVEAPVDDHAEAGLPGEPVAGGGEPEVDDTGASSVDDSDPDSVGSGGDDADDDSEEVSEGGEPQDEAVEPSEEAPADGMGPGEGIPEDLAERIIIFNPGDVSADVTVDAQLPGVEPWEVDVRPDSFAVVETTGDGRIAPGDRYAIHVRSENEIPIVVERARAGAIDRIGVDAGSPVSIAATEILLAGPDGALNVVHNPSSDSIAVVEVVAPAGGATLASIELGPLERATLAELGPVRVTANSGITAEWQVSAPLERSVGLGIALRTSVVDLEDVLTSDVLTLDPAAGDVFTTVPTDGGPPTAPAGVTLPPVATSVIVIDGTSVTTSAPTATSSPDATSTTVAAEGVPAPTTTLGG